jgi:hypothetical protein
MQAYRSLLLAFSLLIPVKEIEASVALGRKIPVTAKNRTQHIN